MDDVAHESLVGKGEFDVSGTGTLVYRRAMQGASALTMLRWVDATGTTEPLQAKPAQYLDLRLSPDGRRVAGDHLRTRLAASPSTTRSGTS